MSLKGMAHARRCGSNGRFARDKVQWVFVEGELARLRQYTA